MQNEEKARQTQNELATRVKHDSRRAGVAHEEWQEMTEDRQRWKEGKSNSKEEQKSEASAGEILKKCGHRCDGGLHMS